MWDETTNFGATNITEDKEETTIKWDQFKTKSNHRFTCTLYSLNIYKVKTGNKS